jgi:glutamate dehydrogenase (NAD(P)+)
MTALSYLQPEASSPWSTYVAQVERVLPYLGPLAHWADTLMRPKRALIVDVPIEMDDGTVPASACLSAAPRVAFASTRAHFR